jgi:hypothetical protein
MPFAIVQIFPMLHVVGEIDLFGGPKAGLVFFIHLPDAGIIDGEDHKPILVLPE